MYENPPPAQDPAPVPPATVQVAAPNVRPVMTYVILAVTVLFFLLQNASQYLLGNDWLFMLGGKYGPLIRDGQVWRLITPVFLHASILHIGFNMYALFLYGQGLEARFGHGRFLLLYFLSAYAGNVLSFLLTPNASLGASTAIFGLLAAEGVFFFQNRKMFGARATRVLVNLFMVGVVNLVIGFSPGSGVDNWGHLGGLLGGLIFTWFGGPRWKFEGLYPSLRLVDEREGHGALAGTAAVLLFFIPLTVLGWIWVIGS